MRWQLQNVVVVNEQRPGGLQISRSRNAADILPVLYTYSIYTSS